MSYFATPNHYTLPAMPEKYPELSERFQSAFIDAVLLIILMFASASILEKYENVPDWVRMALFIGLFFVYEPLFIAMGGTPGNYVKGIRVRKFSNPASRINILQSLLRYPVKVFLGWISFLTIGTNPHRRAIHDMLSGSIVVKTKRTDTENQI